MEKDVVCGMQVDPAKAAGSSEYQGRPITSARMAVRRSSTRIPPSSPSSVSEGCLPEPAAFHL